MCHAWDVASTFCRRYGHCSTTAKVSSARLPALLADLNLRMPDLALGFWPMIPSCLLSASAVWVEVVLGVAGGRAAVVGLWRGALEHIQP